MTLRTLLITVLFALTFATSAQAVAIGPLSLKQFEQDSTYDDPDGNGRTSSTLTYNSATNDFRSPLKRLFCAQLSVKPGDLIDARLWVQLNNGNNANGAWTIGGQQSEHWGLFTMQSTRVSLGPDCDTRWWEVAPALESNFDNWRHYEDVNRAAYFLVPPDPFFAGQARTVYLTAWVYFLASRFYAIPNPVVYAEQQGTYSRLQAAVFRP